MTATATATLAHDAPSRAARIRAAVADLAFALSALPAVLYLGWHWWRARRHAARHHDELGT